MASCSYCARNIAYDADPCPHCGKKNPVSSRSGIGSDEAGGAGCLVLVAAVAGSSYLTQEMEIGGDRSAAAFGLFLLFALIGFVLVAWIVD